MAAEADNVVRLGDGSLPMISRPYDIAEILGKI